MRLDPLVAYNWVRGLHILAVIAWMAGLLYLPRLFAYHTRAEPGGEMDLTFRTMELKLYRFIMGPAMIAAYVFGLSLLWLDRQWRGSWDFAHSPWLITKLLGVVALTWWHHWLGRGRKAFAAGANTRSEKFWRMVNEVPFVLAIIMVLAVTTEFGGR